MSAAITLHFRRTAILPASLRKISSLARVWMHLSPRETPTTTSAKTPLSMPFIRRTSPGQWVRRHGPLRPGVLISSPGSTSRVAVPKMEQL